MILVVIGLCLLEIWWDWRLIEKKQRSPNYKGSNLLRVVIGTVVWCLWSLVPSVSQVQWWFSPVMMFFTFWFMFDYGLNRARKKPLMYLGWRALDLWQREHGGLTFWFWMKLSLMAVSIGVYYLI